MARALFHDLLLNQLGQPVSDVTVEVFDEGTTSPIGETIYAARTGVTTLANPFVIADTGEVEFWLDEADRVDVRYSRDGVTTKTETLDGVSPDDLATAIEQAAEAESFIDGSVVDAFVHFGLAPNAAANSAEAQANRAKFQAAVTAAAAAGVPLKFHAGEYHIEFDAVNTLIDAGIGNLILEGEGSGVTELVFGPNVPAFAFTGLKSSGGVVTLKGIHLAGPADAGPNGLNNAGTVGVSVAPVSGETTVLKLDDVKISGQFSTALRVNGGTDVVELEMDDCDIAAYFQCMEFFRPDAPGNRCHLFNSHFHEAGLDDSTPNLVTGATGHVLYIHPHVSTRIVGCRFTRAGQHGGTGSFGNNWYIHLYGSPDTVPEYVDILDCTFLGSKKMNGVLTSGNFPGANVRGCRFDGIPQSVVFRNSVRVIDCRFSNVLFDETIIYSGSLTGLFVDIIDCRFDVAATTETLLFRCSGAGNEWVVSGGVVNGNGLIRCTTAQRATIKGVVFTGAGAVGSCASAIRMDAAGAIAVIVEGCEFRPVYTLAAINTTSAVTTGTLFVRNCRFSDTVSNNTPPRAVNIDAGAVTVTLGKNQYGNNTVFRLNPGTNTIRGAMGTGWGATLASASRLVLDSYDVGRRRISGSTTIDNLRLVYAATDGETRPMEGLVGAVVYLIAPASGSTWSLASGGNIRPSHTNPRSNDEVVELVLNDSYNWVEVVSPAIAALLALSLLAVNTQTNDYTLVLTDSGKAVEMNKATPVNLTVPPASSVAFADGTVIEVFQMGAGQVTIVAGSGVTITTPETLKLRKQNAGAGLRKLSGDTWRLNGDLEPA